MSDQTTTKPPITIRANYLVAFSYTGGGQPINIESARLMATKAPKIKAIKEAIISHKGLTPRSNLQILSVSQWWHEFFDDDDQNIIVIDESTKDIKRFPDGTPVDQR